jgi:hypothetical protein
MDATEKMLAIEEIKRLKASYLRFVDTKDWQSFEALFAPDASFDLSDDAPGGVVVGAAMIAEMARGPLQQAVTVHHGHCPEIEITSPTSASGIWAMEDRLRWPDETGYPLKSLHGCGHYLETYERSNGRWFIKTVRLKRLWVDTVPR